MDNFFDSIHNDDLGPAVGAFHGIPIRSWSPNATRNRDNKRLAVDLKTRQLLGESNENTAVLLPGEVICSDFIIRRETAEKRQDGIIIPIPEPKNSKRVSIKEALILAEEGACIIWRPDGIIGTSEYALVMNQDDEENQNVL
jgi:hypothetical protein